MASTKAEQGLVAFPLTFPGNQSTFKQNAGSVNSFPDRVTGNFVLEFCLALMEYLIAEFADAATVNS